MSVQRDERDPGTRHPQGWAEALHWASVELAGAMDAEELLQRAADLSARGVKAQEASVYMIERDWLQRRATTRSTGPALTLATYRVGQGAAGLCASTEGGSKYGRPTATNSAGAESWGGLGDVRHVIAAPINGRRGPVGVLQVVNKLDKAARLCDEGFSEEDVRLVNSIASQVAVALRRVTREPEWLQSELHESMNFLHAAVMLPIESAARRVENAQPAWASGELERLRVACSHLHHQLRNLLFELREPLLLREALPAALSSYAQLLSPDLVRVTSDLQMRPAAQVERALFRIGQAAIDNAIRHSGVASLEGGQIVVTLREHRGAVELTVEDNGKGFDPNDEHELRAGYGFVDMLWWARAMGGSLQVESRPGAGTRVTATGPRAEEG